jgi:hypothetical protein
MHHLTQCKVVEAGLCAVDFRITCAATRRLTSRRGRNSSTRACRSPFSKAVIDRAGNLYCVDIAHGGF